MMMRFLTALLTMLLLSSCASSGTGNAWAPPGTCENARRYQVAVYYFPQWHVDQTNMASRGRPWTEWDIIKAAKQRFPGHSQPKIPLWGYAMEDDPQVMAKKIEAAASHGIRAFIFDWYYNEEGPYLAGALDNGYLQAANQDRVQFALMWANHTVTLMWANHTLKSWPGEVSRSGFEKIAKHIVSRYFTRPNYWKIDGKPYFSIYEIGTFINGVGGLENARAALDYLRSQAVAAGLKGIHLNVVDFELKNRPDAAKLLKVLGADSVTSYTWSHHVPLKELGFPTVDYLDVAGRYAGYRDMAKEKYGVPYHPNVMMGWDPTPRMGPNQAFDGRGYPNTPVVIGNTPGKFEAVLRQTKAVAAKIAPPPSVITINAWNEWGEGSYLEPDTKTGFGYLNAIQDVFGCPAGAAAH